MSKKSTSFSLPSMMREEIGALLDSGEYSSRSDVVRDAFRTFLENKPEKRILIGVELYKKEKVSLTRAAEIARVDLESFKDILKDRGVELRTYSDTKEEMEEDLKKYDPHGH